MSLIHGFSEVPRETRTADVWYDRNTRSWVVQIKDEFGNQIGDADYVATKSEALDIAARLRRHGGQA